MSDTPDRQPAARARVFINLGSGPKGSAPLPSLFASWREVRVDADPAAAPDILASLTDLSAIETGSVDAVWAAHCLEHLYLHQIGSAVGEAYRVLNDGGFLGLIVPDLQTLAEYLLQDRLHEVIYESPAGPITAHDIVFGYGPYLAQGRHGMAHRCGFTPTLLMQILREAPFAEIVLRRRAPAHELMALACKRAPASDAERDALLAGLQP
jgi:hypothetical protein